MLNLYELAKVIKEKISVSGGSDGFCVQFLNCEVKDHKTDSIIGSCWGEGPTIDIAADNYFRKINGKWLVFDAHPKEKRREYSAEIAMDVRKQDVVDTTKESGAKIGGNDIVFSTGKKVFVNLGIVGLSKSSNGNWTVTGGHDDRVPDKYFTKEEKEELADYMINLWQEWKDTA